jgi:hypothetical protein
VQQLIDNNIATMDLSYDAVASSRYLMHAHIILYQDFESTDDQNAPPKWLDTRRYDPPYPIMHRLRNSVCSRMNTEIGEQYVDHKVKL